MSQHASSAHELRETCSMLGFLYSFFLHLCLFSCSIFSSFPKFLFLSPSFRFNGKKKMGKFNRCKRISRNTGCPPTFGRKVSVCGCVGCWVLVVDWRMSTSECRFLAVLYRLFAVGCPLLVVICRLLAFGVGSC